MGTTPISDSVSDIFWGEPDNYGILGIGGRVGYWGIGGEGGVGNRIIIQIILDKQAIGVVGVKGWGCLSWSGSRSTHSVQYVDVSALCAFSTRKNHPGPARP